MESKYPSLSPYCYVGGNPVRFVDITGMDSTVYVYFDPASEHFGGKKNKSNREKVLDQMRLLFSKNNVNVNIVETLCHPDQSPQGMLDPTDQYVALMSTLPNVEEAYGAMAGSLGGTPSNNDYSISYVNLAAHSFEGVNTSAWYSGNSINFSALANTATHEAMHGYLERATDYLNANAYNGLDETGHLDSPLNLMTTASLRYGSIPNRTISQNTPLRPSESLNFVHKMMINHYINANYKNYPSYVPSPFVR